MEPGLNGTTTGSRVADPGPVEVGSVGWIAGSVAVSVAIALALGYVANAPVRARLSTIRRLPPGRLDDPTLTTEETEEVARTPAPSPERAQAGSRSLFQAALGRSRDLLRSGFDRIFGGKPVDRAGLDALEEVLLRADVGIATTERLVKRVEAASAANPADATALRGALRAEMRAMLDATHRPFAVGGGGPPWVVLVVGVNGSGKTTTIGKLAARLAGEGKRVLLAAGDTYRAAAEQQLSVWAERAGVAVIALDEGADPGAVAYKAVERARAEAFDVVIVDTAGRLQTRKPLMEQLGKVRRVLDKAVPGAPHETLLVLDGTMGQNGMSQAKLFNDATPITGVVVTKLDGTAKGGMVLSIATELGLPVKLVGLGEKITDLRDFDPEQFVDALV